MSAMFLPKLGLLPNTTDIRQFWKCESTISHQRQSEYIQVSESLLFKESFETCILFRLPSGVLQSYYPPCLLCYYSIKLSFSFLQTWRNLYDICLYVSVIHDLMPFDLFIVSWSLTYFKISNRALSSSTSSYIFFEFSS